MSTFTPPPGAPQPLIRRQHYEKTDAHHGWRRVRAFRLLRNENDPDFGMDIDTGCTVIRIAPGSAADLAGVEPGMVVVTINGEPIEGIHTITDFLRSKGRSTCITFGMVGGRRPPALCHHRKRKEECLECSDTVLAQRRPPGSVVLPRKVEWAGEYWWGDKLVQHAVLLNVGDDGSLTGHGVSGIGQFQAQGTVDDGGNVTIQERYIDGGEMTLKGALDLGSSWIDGKWIQRTGGRAGKRDQGGFTLFASRVGNWTLHWLNFPKRQQTAPTLAGRAGTLVEALNLAGTHSWFVWCLPSTEHKDAEKVLVWDESPGTDIKSELGPDGVPGWVAGWRRHVAGQGPPLLVDVLGSTTGLDGTYRRSREPGGGGLYSWTRSDGAIIYPGNGRWGIAGSDRKEASAVSSLRDGPSPTGVKSWMERFEGGYLVRDRLQVVSVIHKASGVRDFSDNGFITVQEPDPGSPGEVEVVDPKRRLVSPSRSKGDPIGTVKF